MQPHSQPDFGPHVFLFDPTMAAAAIQECCDDICARQERNEMGAERYALLFKPGTYTARVRVGFGTHVAGLGQRPGDVRIHGAVSTDAEWAAGNATLNFWRICENISMIVPPGEVHQWAVLQAAPLRRVHVQGSSVLVDSSWASGGFIADSRFDGTVDAGGQQQWISRNSSWNAWQGGSWNVVFVGVENPPIGTWPERPYSTIPATPVIREKPFLRVDERGLWSVFVPALRRGSRGHGWEGHEPGTAIPLQRFYVARPDRDTAATINQALARGQHLLLTPGVYRLGSALRVERPGTVILGLGLPVLIPQSGQAALDLADVDDLSVAGVVCDAGPCSSPVLVQIGQPGCTADHALKPTVLHDVYVRHGGMAAGMAEVSMVIHSRHVIGDNLWLWRADHGRGVRWDTNPGRTGLIVHGDDVTVYGLFVEHYQEYQTQWHGERGQVYLYQSEMPYDPPSAEAWHAPDKRGWPSYQVADQVREHQVWGAGVYCSFHAPGISADCAIVAPDHPGVRFTHTVTFRLAGRASGTIDHIINRSGDAASVQHVMSRLLSYPIA